MSDADRVQHVRKALENDRQRRFDRVDHARRFIAHDETERVPDVLSVTVQQRQFFLRVQTNGIVVIERAEGKMTNTQLGTVGAQNIIPSELCDDVFKIIQADLIPVVVITEIGEALVPDAKDTDAAKLSPYSERHHLCGGCVEMHRVTAIHQVLSCRSCNLRVVIPADIETWGQLRAWSSKNFPPEGL